MITLEICVSSMTFHSSVIYLQFQNIFNGRKASRLTLTRKETRTQTKCKPAQCRADNKKMMTGHSKSTEKIILKY